VLRVYETARKWSLAHPNELKAALVTATKMPDAVIARQLERTDLSSGLIGDTQAKTIIEAGKALQVAGVLDAGADVTSITNSMIDPSFIKAVAA
jgi:sulfonate transport system substrate-binding protein